QVTLSRSSVEAEYKGIVNVVVETAWIHNLLHELRVPLFITTLVYCDNVSVVYLPSECIVSRLWIQLERTNSSGSSFWNVETSSTGTTPIVDKIRKLENLIIDGKITLVDDDGKPLKKVDYPGDYDNEDEVELVDNDMARSMASERVGFGTKSLLEQWRDTHENGDYDEDPYDDDSNNFVIVSISPDDWKELLKREVAKTNNFVIVSISLDDWKELLKREGMAVTPLGTKLIQEVVEFDAELFYDAHKVATELSDGILKVKFPIGTKETMMAETFSNRWLIGTCLYMDFLLAFEVVDQDLRNYYGLWMSCGHVYKVLEFIAIIVTWKVKLLKLCLSVMESDYLDGSVLNPKRPFAAIVSDSKVSSKIRVTESLLGKCDILLSGGGMNFTFYKAQDLSVGSHWWRKTSLNLQPRSLLRPKEFPYGTKPRSVIQEECPKNPGLGVAKNLKKPSQASRGVPPIANTSGNKKNDVEPTKKVSNSNPFDVLNSVENDVDLGTNGGTLNLVSKEPNSSGSSFWSVESSSTSTTPIVDKIGKYEKLIIDGKVTLVDNEDEPVKKVDNSVDHDSEDEVASVDNDMAHSMASEKENYDENDDYEYDPYDDDMYEGQENSDKIQAICDNLDIKVRGKPFTQKGNLWLVISNSNLKRWDKDELAMCVREALEASEDDDGVLDKPSLQLRREKRWAMMIMGWFKKGMFRVCGRYNHLLGRRF
ncbi:zinc finger, CCHC-type containing protein, partial [Tanacetum coccineum]